MDRGSDADIEALPDVVVTRQDRARLRHVIIQYAPILSWPAVAFLAGELRRARIVDAAEIPASTATMDSVVAVRDGESDTGRAVRLVYPGDPALRGDHGVCILTPLGAALFGLSEGQSIAYAGPGEKRRTITLVKVLDQPETSGERRPRPADPRGSPRQPEPRGSPRWRGPIGDGSRSGAGTSRGPSGALVPACGCTGIRPGQDGRCTGEQKQMEHPMNPPGAAEKDSVVCSFCGRAEGEVSRLFAGPMASICDGCVETSSGLIQRERWSRLRRFDGGLFEPCTVKAALDEVVVGQERAKRVLSVAVANHYKRLANASYGGDVELGKSNVLLIGPSGSGKTLLAETLGRIVDVPFAAVDATTLTEAGYVGQDVESVLLRLLDAADCDVERARRGIVYIDEIDKIGRRADGPPLARDIGGEGVQQALLRMLEGARVSVPLPGQRWRGSPECVEVDTADVLFICGGTFAGLNAIVTARARGSGLGFGAILPDKPRSDDILRAEVEQDDLLAFGLIPELVGRLPVIATLDDLDEAALVEILTAPRNALVAQYQQLFAMEGVRLEFTADALEGIAAAARRKRTGARGLRSILEQILLDVMFDLPDRAGVATVVIDRDAVDGKAPPVYLRADEWRRSGTRGR